MIVAIETLWLFFIVKHFIVDFLMQPQFMWQNKGNLFHPGGYAHAALHGVVTDMFLWMMGVPSPVAIFIGFFEFVIHYAIDWSKVNINKLAKWDANKNPEFWYLLGLDQLLHYATYWIIIHVMMGALLAH